MKTRNAEGGTIEMRNAGGGTRTYESAQGASGAGERVAESVTANGDLKERTRDFALNIIAFTDALPKDESSRVMRRQLLHAGTAVGANDRSAKRARSNADFISRMGIVEEEADEAWYWLELLTASGKVASEQSLALLQESSELVAIAVASINTARGGTRRKTAE